MPDAKGGHQLQLATCVNIGVNGLGMLTDNDIGIYSGDYEQFKTDVGRLLADPSARKEMGDRAHAFAREQSNAEANVEKLVAFKKQDSRASPSSREQYLCGSPRRIAQMVAPGFAATFTSLMRSRNLASSPYLAASAKTH